MAASASLLRFARGLAGLSSHGVAQKHFRNKSRVKFTPHKRAPVSCSLSLPDQYGYVMGSVATTALVIQWMSVRVALSRRECKVAYPAVYADGDSMEATRFNCTQRAHQNTLESVPMLLALEILLGLQFPLYAASLGMIWNAGRIWYALGYSTGDPGKRTPGSAISGIVYLALIISTLVTGSRLAIM